jgi:hypothetical protein
VKTCAFSFVKPLEQGRSQTPNGRRTAEVVHGGAGGAARRRGDEIPALTSLPVVAAGVILPITPLGRTPGSVSLPPLFYAPLAAIVAVYEVAVPFVKT